MKMLIIADLHFDENNDWNFISNITDNMICRINKKISENEELIIIVLGDIINRGGIGDNVIKFSEADKFIDIIKSSFNNVKILFIPGNHEIERNSFELSAFNDFCQRHSYKKNFVFTMDSSVFSFEEAKLNFILVDSTLTRNHDSDGKIDIKTLKSKMLKGKNIIFMHHPPCQQEGADRSIINEKELIATHSNFIFYGHQHGNVKVPDFLNNNTDIHSVGTLFKQEKGCSNEFLLLDITDGRINFAYRYVWAVTNFISNLLFPVKSNVLSDHIPLSSPDKNEKSIVRKLKKMSNSYENGKEFSIWHKYISENIDQVIKKHALVFLLGDAGIGKSFELANIYWQYEDDVDYFPIWINLRNTSFSNVINHINLVQYNTIDRKNPFLILDGLDEMDGGEIARLVRELGSATHDNPEAKILLSSRTNFKVSMGSKFVEYSILPLTVEQIIATAAANGVVNSTDFLECLKSVDCLALAQTPFYLFDIIRIYMESRSLPKKELLLNEMILNRFKKGDDKFPDAYSKTLIGNEYDLRCQLKELGFIIQSLHIFSLSNEEYTQHFSSGMRELFIKSGLITSEQSGQVLYWRFEHNIFREYFVADYLANISFIRLLEIITYDKDKKKLRPSWVNIVSFLISMQKDDNLISWLIENAPETISKFESDRITATDREKIFVCLMQDSFDRNIPFYALYEEEKFAKFLNSKNSLCFLLNAINNPANNATVLGTISMLQYLQNFYGMEQELKNAIIPYTDIMQPEYTISTAVRALMQLFNEDLSSLTAYLFNSFRVDKRPEVVGALCRLFIKANVADNYADYLFNIFEIHDKLQENYSVWKQFLMTIKSFKNHENILKSIRILCSDMSVHIYKSDELFEELIIKMFEMCKDEGMDLLDNLVDIFVCAARKCDKRKSKIVKQFFCNTGLLNDALSRILKLEIPPDAMMFSIEDIMDTSLLDTLISSYQSDEVDPDTFKWYARRQSKELVIFEKLNEAVFQKEGLSINVDQVKDWENIRREGNQKYFDCLFEKPKFKTMLDELVSFLGNTITCAELLGDSFSKIPYDRQDMQNIRTALYHNGNKKCTVTTFLDNVDWNKFAISEVCRMLESRETFEISLAQHELLATYFHHAISLINFEEQNDTTLYITRRIVLLQNRFKFGICDEKLLEMLMLPWYFFESSTSSGDSETLNFILQNISNKEMLSEKIIYNTKNTSLNPLAMQTHILYCAREGLLEGVDIAIDLFKNTSEEAKWHKNSAVDYLIAMKGEKFVSDLVDDSIDNNTLTYLACQIKVENGKIVSLMAKRNSESENPLLLLNELLKLNNRYALEKYYELAKETNALPDLLPDRSHIEETTMAIREINDISLCDLICNLFKLCYSKGFRDKDSFGLRGALDSVISNFIQANKYYTKEMLTTLINDCSDNERLISTCNWHINNIDKLINVSSDTPWDKETILAFVKARRADSLAGTLLI